MKFSTANSKLKKLYAHTNGSLANWLAHKIGRATAKVYSFDLLSGWDCPFAHNCKSKAVVEAGKKRRIEDGKHTKFRCFSASQEVLFPNVYDSRKNNSDAMHELETSEQMADELESVLPPDARIVRIHVAGDFYNVIYFLAWCLVAKRNPQVLFYAYTKSLKYWAENTDNVPPNLVLTASRGGRDDHLIEEHGLRSAKVVFSESEAAELGLEIDSDDSHACDPAKAGQDFALLIHGVQPKGSEAAKALKLLKS